MMIPASEDEEEIISKSPSKKSSPGTKSPVKSDGGGTEEGKGKKATKYVTIPSIEYPVSVVVF